MARLLHGDTPAADADAALTFVAGRPTYAAVHIAAVLAATTIAIGIMALASSLTRPSAWLLGRAGTTTAVIGTAIFGVESTSEGLALPELTSAAQADPGQRADIVKSRVPLPPQLMVRLSSRSRCSSGRRCC